MNIYMIHVSNSFVAVFNESMVAGLRFYCEKDEWNETSTFVEFVLKLWKIMNVKTPYKGEFNAVSTIN